MTDAPAAARRVPIGLVTGAFGADGEVRVRWLGDDALNLLEAEVVWISRSDSDPLPRRHAVRTAEVLGGDEVRMQLAGLAGRDDAAAYKNHLVLVEETALEPLEDGEFYWHQLVGCRVESSEGEVLGTVTALWETGPHDVLVIERPAGAVPDAEDGAAAKPLLIPTAREFLTEIDIEAGRVVVELLPGLLEV
jgi:16S rRNA processing protein RimM